MSPVLFQRLIIKTLSLLLMTAVVFVRAERASIFDHLEQLEASLVQFDKQHQTTTTTTPMTTTDFPLITIMNEYDSNETMALAPMPPSVAMTMDRPDSDDIAVVTINAKNPQPFTILMNFQNDGTMSLMVYNQDQTSWSDQGRCRHGQMYDPVSNVCRDVFCAQGYVLRPQGCVLDENFNSTYDQPIKPPPGEMRVEVTLKHSLCSFIGGYNDTTDECNKHQRVLKPSDRLLESFRKSFVKLLEVNDERVTNMTLKSYLVLNESSIIYTNTNPMMSMINSNTDSHPYPDDTDDNDDIDEKFMNVLIRYETKELLTFLFDIKDMKDFPGETRETIVLFYQLTLYTLDKRFFNVGPGHKAYITDVDEVKPETDEIGWCEDVGDHKEYSRSDFRVLASFEDIRPVYFVYLPETHTIYRTGYYYFTVIYQRQPVVTSTNSPGGATNSIALRTETPELTTEYFEEFDNSSIMSRMLKTGSSILLLSLIDVTDIVIEQNATNTISSKILSVCNRSPRIITPCINHETVRLSLCELDFMIDSSYCMRKSGHCFFIDEYERDPIEPDKYIRVCKYQKEKDNSTMSNLAGLSGIKLQSDYDINVAISGWASFILTIISIVSMIFCLITFALFRELRNIPGWNIINLTLALTLAQIAYVIGSFVIGNNVFCFSIAIITHYGFLASFFWMNVIAFDLYRNFRKKASHVLLQSITVKARLPFYALYAWTAPLLIVLASLTVDLVNKQAFNLTPFRPCYAGYLEGCNRLSGSSILPTKSNVTEDPYVLENAFFKDMASIVREHPMNVNDTFADLCVYWASQNEPHYVLVMGGSCWIRSGSANLIFFGLPIAIILVVNALFFFVTIYNIRRKKIAQKQSSLRRFSRVKLPGDEDVKFYIQMAVIMGFTWIIGFFLTSIRWPNDTELYIIFYILTYAFIILNASTGVLILFAFLFKKEVKKLYKKLFARICSSKLDRANRVNPKTSSVSSSATVSGGGGGGGSNKKVTIATTTTKSSRIRENSQSSTSQLCPAVKTITSSSTSTTLTHVKPLSTSNSSVSSSALTTTPRLDSLNEENEQDSRSEISCFDDCDQHTAYQQQQSNDDVQFNQLSYSF